MTIAHDLLQMQPQQRASLLYFLALTHPEGQSNGERAARRIWLALQDFGSLDTKAQAGCLAFVRERVEETVTL